MFHYLSSASSPLPYPFLITSHSTMNDKLEDNTFLYEVIKARKRKREVDRAAVGLSAGSVDQSEEVEVTSFAPTLYSFLTPSYIFLFQDAG